jgi:hypothetical protein
VDALFHTSSLNIVAWLLSKGYQIKDKVKINNQTVFFFDRDENLQKVIDEYNNNQELKLFISKFREVKIMAKE